ncbi:hypothetical protein [Halorubrum sp. PV6]|uniref:hypothetical protein n=1 Tax=Halorubrum sp. PV6 TaxID=634157 RepID=UPI001FCEE599|nr:hypothetical protein [Halorubrum sp. PV6]
MSAPEEADEEEDAEAQRLGGVDAPARLTGRRREDETAPQRLDDPEILHGRSNAWGDPNGSGVNDERRGRDVEGV